MIASPPSSLADLRSVLPSLRDEGHARRARGVTMSREAGRQLWGQYAGVPIDALSGELATATVAELGRLMTDPACGPIAVLKRLAAQGEVDSGIGVITREDVLPGLEATLHSVFLFEGTATAEGRGTGMTVTAQMVISGTSVTVARLFPSLGISPNVDGTPTVRLTLRGLLTGKGIDAIRGTLCLADLPPLSVRALRPLLAGKDVDIGLEMPLAIISSPGMFLRLELRAEKGFRAAGRAPVGALAGDADEVPGKLVTVFEAEGRSIGTGDSARIRLDRVDVDLDSEVKLGWNARAEFHLAYRDADGELRRYKPGAAIEAQLTQSALLAAMRRALDTREQAAARSASTRR